MASINNRIKKLEKLQTSGLQRVSDKDLNSRITELCNKPDINDWLVNVNDTNTDPQRLRAFGLMMQQSVGFQ
jgi:hypothetical protein